MNAIDSTAPESAPTPPKTEEPPLKPGKLPPNYPGSFDAIADLDRCPSISAVRAVR